MYVLDVIGYFQWPWMAINVPGVDLSTGHMNRMLKFHPVNQNRRYARRLSLFHPSFSEKFTAMGLTFHISYVKKKRAFQMP